MAVRMHHGYGVTLFLRHINYTLNRPEQILSSYLAHTFLYPLYLAHRLNSNSCLILCTLRTRYSSLQHLLVSSLTAVGGIISENKFSPALLRAAN